MKTSVVTGASRGIGLATARLFLAKGWRVIGTYNQNQVPISDERFAAVRLDLTSAESISQAADLIGGLTEQVDALINNAGICRDSDQAEIKMDVLRTTFEANLFGVIDFTERMLVAFPRISRIINVSSKYSAQSFPIDYKTHSTYRMAKAALNMYTRTLDFRLQALGTHVSALDPGWVKTDMGMFEATATRAPDREPDEAAEDVYQLTTEDVESGQFWRRGMKREW
jgi:NAD(P)-dependent dehydrogenase (short-subunit alcohol dehydrogenase family)